MPEPSGDVDWGREALGVLLVMAGFLLVFLGIVFVAAGSLGGGEGGGSGTVIIVFPFIIYISGNTPPWLPLLIALFMILFFVFTFIVFLKTFIRRETW